MTYLFHYKRIGFWGILLITMGVALDSVFGVMGFILATVGVLLVLTCLYQWKDEEDS
jgi:hypothetical protein